MATMLMSVEFFDFEIQRSMLLNPNIQWQFTNASQMGFEMITKFLQSRVQLTETQPSKIQLVIDRVLDFLEGDPHLPCREVKEELKTVLLASAGLSATFASMQDLVRPFHDDATGETTIPGFEKEAVLSHCVVAAAALNNTDMLRRLLELGANVTTISQYFGEPLSIAAYHGSLDAFTFLLQNGATLGTNGPAPTYAFNTLSNSNALSYAILAGQDHIIEEMVEKCEIFLPAREWGKALAYAARTGHLSTLELIVQYAGNNIGLQDFEIAMTGEVFAGACRRGWIPLVKWLLDQAAYFGEDIYLGRMGFQSAAAGGHVRVLEMFVAHAAAVSSTQERNLTQNILFQALEFAIANGHYGAVEYLLQKGASLEKTNQNFHTPLDLAYHASNIDMANFLIARGAKLNNLYKWSALKNAASRGNEDQISFLLQNGIAPDPLEDTSSAQFRQESPLFAALLSCHFRIARRLLKAGATPVVPPGKAPGDKVSAVQWDVREWGCRCTYEQGCQPWHRQTIDDEAWKEFDMDETVYICRG